MIKLVIEGETWDDIMQQVQGLTGTQEQNVLACNDVIIQQVSPVPHVIPTTPQAVAPTPTPTQPQVCDVDIDGNMWDDNIHSSSKKQTKAGRWVMRKGGAKTATVTTQEAPALPMQPPGEQVQEIPQGVEVGGVPPVPVSTTPPIPAQPETLEFGTFMKHVLTLQSDGKIGTQQITEICQSFGLNDVMAAVQHKDKMPALLVAIQNAAQ